MDKEPLVQVEPTSELLEIAESRLPQSCNVFNMILMAMKREAIKATMQFYVIRIGKEDLTSLLIVAMVQREDYGTEISISVPSSHQLDEIEMTKILLHTKVIKWTEPFIICTLDRSLSKFFISFCINILGVPTKVRPCNLYMMDRNVAKTLEILTTDPNVQLKSLDSDFGVDFVTKYWHHSIAGSDKVIRRILNNLPSVGVFYHNELVSCITTAVSGFYGFLHTLKTVRGRGFGKLVELALIKQLGDEGYVPFCVVEIQNHISIKIHNKIHQDLKLSHNVDFIFHIPDSFDD